MVGYSLFSSESVTFVDEMKKIFTDIIKLGCSLALGGGILYWMYRDFDFNGVRHILVDGMDWGWMLLSFPFGILAQTFRAWRWRISLEPLGEKPRASVAMNSIFLSYAASLVVPRIGEFARCGILHRYDGVSFPKSLGTVVTERIIDSILLVCLALVTIVSQADIFATFFSRTGVGFDHLACQFSLTGWVVTGVCGMAALVFGGFLLKKLYIYNKVKQAFDDVLHGILSLRHVRSIPKYAFFTIGIWASYFLHYYLTFFSFPPMSDLGMSCAMVTFVVGSIAVIVPTPNGAGPWHFAVKTMLILYGVASVDALYFVLIVHAVQTLLVVALGIFASVSLAFCKTVKSNS